MAGEAAAGGAGEAGAAGGAGGAGGGAAAGGAAGGMPSMPTADAPKGVLMAIAVLLLWLAGVALFIAFEGSQIIGEQIPAAGGGGGSYFRAAIEGLTNKAQTRQKASAGE